MIKVLIHIDERAAYGLAHEQPRSGISRVSDGHGSIHEPRTILLEHLRVHYKSARAEDDPTASADVFFLTVHAHDNSEDLAFRVDDQGQRSGGFVMNTEMLKQYCPRLVDGPMPIGNPGDTGTGLLMGQAVGGALINMDQHFITLPFIPPLIAHLWNLRQCSGPTFHQRRLLSLTHRIFRAGSTRRENLFDHFGRRLRPSSLHERTHCRYGGKRRGVSRGSRASSRHAPPHGRLLFGTCRPGEDPLFHKSPEWLKAMPPPYAALDCTLGEGAIYAAFTLGGLDTRPSGEVLTTEKEAIPGLYAAGRTACGIPRNAAGYASGLSVGDATFFGRVAGSNCAQRSPGSETR